VLSQSQPVPQQPDHKKGGKNNMTTHYAPQAKGWAPARESDAGNVHGVIGYCPASSLTLAQNDIIQMVKIPLGAIVMDCILETGALGSNVLGAVGDDALSTLYITAQSVASACVLRKNNVSLAGVPKRYAVEDTIDVTLTNANPADNIAIRLDVLYICGVDETP
jgi:hypothetical protein